MENTQRLRVGMALVIQASSAREKLKLGFVDRLRQANGVDLVKAKVQSPVSKWIRVPLGVGFSIMTAHERRHLWQARQVTQDPRFPRS